MLESMSQVREIDLQENVCHEQKTIASDELLAREKVLLLDQDPANPSDEKYKYSIAQLLEIQQCAPSDCPESLLASPVRNDASALNKKATFLVQSEISHSARKDTNAPTVVCSSALPVFTEVSRCRWPS
ncbi:hypothetical protein PsorP6_009426 [Peronosclerospora sorghi]|uniref:Uncharacterized protein n=1 Tax=Peronosclerospora sorghi TaxID=230839 RepID=A0ACC0VXE8_9STRA|nr:hypothetical protein PsorP6_009426 [Peronosclerospora sorghi]